MSYLKVYSGSLLALLLAVGWASGADKPAATPEEAIKQLGDAAKAGDIDGVLASLAEGPRKTMTEIIKLMDDMAKAQKVFDEALETKFGKDPNPKPKLDFDMKKQLKDSFVKLEVLGKKDVAADKVELTVKATAKDPTGKEQTKEEKIVAVKEKEGWKLIPPDMDDPKQFEAVKGFITKNKTALEGITKDVKDGKFKSRDEANKALTEALLKSLAG